jgi:hypothetical protein
MCPILLRLLASFFVLPPPPPPNDGESESPDESSPPSPQHQLAAAPPPQLPPPPPPQLYASQRYANHEEIIWPGAPDHPNRQTCQLAGSAGHFQCSPRRPCRRPHPSAQVEITPQMTLPDATNGHGDIHLLWEDDFDWEENWEENDGAAAAADNLYNYMEGRNAAAANGDHGDAYCWGNDWNEAEDEDFNQINQDLPLLHPDRGDRNESPLSVHSSLPLLESVPSTPPSSPPPLQLQYIPDGDAGPTYALQVGPSLHLQPVQQRLALLHQLRNVLISEGEEENILSRRTSPAAVTARIPATAAAARGNTGRRRRRCSAPTGLGFAARRRPRSV